MADENGAGRYWEGGSRVSPGQRGRRELALGLAGVALVGMEIIVLVETALVGM